MGFLKKFSLRGLADRFGQTLKRFPVAMLLVIFLTCFIIYICHGGKMGDKLEFFFIFYPATGALLAVSLSLLTEDFKSKIRAWFTQLVVHLIWFGVSAYLAQIDRFSLPQLIAVCATIVAIGLAVFLICFYRRNREMPFWNFSTRTVVALGVAAAIGDFLALGLLLLVESLKMLFGLHINDVIYLDIWTVCMVLLAPSMFMILIPKGENKYQADAPEFSRFAKGVVQYLFLPLLGLYIITLYAYAAKILLQWSLPVGNVSYLVSGSMVLMVLLIYITYPLQFLEGNKLFKGVTRCLPVLMLPLLALMTVAIGRRLSDYGITVSRLYLLVFNIWCYAVCLWLIFTRNKRIWLIPASFAVILFLISVGPQSIANATQHRLLDEARDAFIASGIKQLPLTGEQYEKWLKEVEPKVAASIDSKLRYLQNDYGYDTTNELLAKDAETGNHAELNQNGELAETNEKYSSFYNNSLIKDNSIPQGYSQMSLVEFTSDGVLKDSDRVVLDVRLNPVRGVLDAVVDRAPVVSQFEISIKKLKEFDSDRNPKGIAEPLSVDNGEALLVINQFTMTIENKKDYYINGVGLLFTK